MTIGFWYKPFTQRQSVHSLLPLVVVWSYFRKLYFGSLAVVFRGCFFVLFFFLFVSPLIIRAHNPSLHACTPSYTEVHESGASLNHF